MNYLEQYHNLIQNGEVVVGYWIRKEVQNLVDDMSNPDYIYDTTEAHKRIKFMQTLCLQSKHPYFGKPVQLMPWQLAFTEALYSFKMADTGLRRFVEALLEIGRKNGKSTFLAADGNTDLFIGEGGAEICCASNYDKQCRHLRRYTMSKILTDPVTGKPLVASNGKVMLAPVIPTGAATKQEILLDPVTNKPMVTSQGKIIMVTVELVQQLPAPTNLSASGTEVTFDEVTNATSYEVYADGTKIGEDAGTPAVSYPVKGQLITMNLGNETPAAGTNNQYRVLGINGSIAEVVAMYDMSTSKIFGADNTYSGSDLDTYLNTTFYNSLSSTAKSAIVDKNITQYEYTHNSSIYSADTHASYADYSTKANKAVVGSRHVYALDVEDIETYFNNTFSTANIWTLFWNTTAKPSPVTYPRLRSADADGSYDAWGVYGNYGGVDDLDVNFNYAARPALTIDLSKISWSK